MEVKVKDVLIALVASVVIYFVVVGPVGIAAAIAVPEGYFEWYKGKSIEWLALPILNLITVVPAMTIPPFLVTFIMVRYFTSSWLIPCLTIVLAYFIYFNVSSFLIWLKHPDFYTLNGLRAFLPSMWLPLAVIASGYLASKRNHTDATVGILNHTALKI